MISAYVRSMRPETWPLASLATIFSGLMATGFDMSVGGILLLLEIAIILSVIVLGAINMFNEVYDTNQDKVNKPTRPIVSGKLSPRSALYASLALFALALVWTVVVSPVLFILTLALVFLGVAYSLPGVRLKDNAVTAMLTLGLGYGVIMPIAAWLVYENASSVTGALIAAIGFLWFAGTTNFKDFKDRPGDEKSGIPTLVVMKGEFYTLRLMMLMMAVAPACLLVAYVALSFLPAGSLLALLSLGLTLFVIVRLYLDYSPEKAFTGYKMTYMLYPLLFMLLAIGFLGAP